MKVRYFGTYQGPSYGSYGMPETMDAFPSISSAKLALWKGVVDQWSDRTEYRENPEGGMVKWQSLSGWMYGTTNEDTIELYAAEEIEPGVYERSEGPVMRLSMGPRRGVNVERY